jgi:hypothetical protein
MLRPFYFEHPVIFSVPIERLDLLNSPVPLVCGVNLNKKIFERKLKEKRIFPNDQTVLVFLDLEDFKFDYSDTIRENFVSPRLRGNKLKVKKAYDEFRENNRLNKKGGGIVWTQDYKMGLTIAMTLKKGFDEMLRGLPDEPFYVDDTMDKVFFFPYNFFRILIWKL